MANPAGTMVKKWMHSLYESSNHQNYDNILSLMDPNPTAKLLDLGCDDGKWTKRVAGKLRTRSISGIEIIPERAAIARREGIEVTEGDLAKPLTLEADSFDVVHANQVIEHVPDIDLFTREIFRVTKPGGYAVVSTENASSWHNLGAMALGFQMFSLTNVSALRGGLGNPFAIHRDTKHEFSSWTHKTIFSYQGLLELFVAHGFERVEIKGAGYYPLPASLGIVDPRHAHFITARAYKPR